MGNPGIANLCQDARGGEFGQANAGNSTAGEHIFHCNCNSLRGSNEKYINQYDVLTNKQNEIICVIKSLYETFSIQ